MLAALEQLGVEPSQGAYVGDSPFDIQSAKAAGVVPSRSRGEASTPTSCCSKQSPDAFVRSPDELLDVL